MDDTKHTTAAPGTVDQRPRWEGSEERRPRGYLPATDDPDQERDAAGENLQDPERESLADAFDQKSPEDDARGQTEKRHAGGSNDGNSNAKRRTLPDDGGQNAAARD